MTSSASVRGLVNMTALAVVEAQEEEQLEKADGINF
jgi:hypothetical protein